MRANLREIWLNSGPLWVALLAATAAVLFPVIAVSGDWHAILSHDPSQDSASRQLWFVLVSMEAAVWVLIAAWLIDLGLRLVRDQGIHLWQWVAEVFIPIVLVAGLIVLLTFGNHLTLLFPSHRNAIPPSPDPCTGAPMIPPPCLGPYHITNMPIVGGTGLFIAFGCVLGMFSLRLALRSLGKSDDLGSRVTRYIQLHTDLRSCLLLASLVLGLGTLTGAALRNAVNSVSIQPKFPTEYIIAYGLINSVFLIVLYFPIEYAFLKAGIRLEREYAGESGDDADSIGRWQKRVAEASQLLGTDWMDLRGIGGALAALMPAVAGMLTHLLSGK